MAKINELISQVPDAGLRARLATTATALSSRVTLGLNFERHIPEYVALPGLPIRPGMLAAERAKSHGLPLKVLRTEGSEVVCVHDGDDAAEIVTFPRSALVAIKRSNEPIFPALRHVETVSREETIAHHVLIEGENHAVLQLMAWTHHGRIDCIYIDPPYNTGARDWRYNNDYVDRNDAFRSSKWLSMMERRLLLARKLLAPDGVLIVAIDDYEYAHLVMLLNSERLFRGWTIETVVIQHNPRGGGGNHISNTHEYAVFVVPPGRSLSPIARGQDELRDFRRRGRGDNNRRSGRPKSFFAILVEPESRRVVGVGPEIGKDDPYETSPTPDGLVRVYPMGRDGLERVWRNTRVAVEEGIKTGSLDLRCTRNDTIVQVIAGEKKAVPIRSIWSGSRYNAGEQGTNLVEALTGVEFPYPKSIYTVLDCVKAAVGERPQAVVLDFFGGSGTTAHAVQLLNEIDDGARQSIVVTNNEVGEPAEKALLAEGKAPGDPEWEAQGICQAVTFARIANAIKGERADGTAVEWEFELDETAEVEREIDVQILPFVGPAQASSPEARASLAPFIGAPAKSLKDGWPYHVPASGSSSRLNVAVLFDPEKANEFAAELSDAEHVERVYILSSGSRRRDNEMAGIVREAVGPRIAEIPLKRGAAEGLRASLSYLRMEYLDPASVEIGRNFAELLPTLWLMAGGAGSVPTDDETGFLLPADSNWAVLIHEDAFRRFKGAVEKHSNVEWVFIVSDSDDAFQQISAALPDSIPTRQRVRLYRDYLTNFRINLSDR